MKDKDKKASTKLKDPKDFTLIQLRKKTVAKLKEMKFKHFKSTGETIEYDLLIQNLIKEN